MGKNWQGGKGGQRYHKGRQGRMVQPGVSGFLFTTTTGPVDKAKREVEGLLDTYLPRAKAAGCVFRTQDPEPTVDSGETAPDVGPGASMSSMLMAELNEVRGGTSEPTNDDRVGQKRSKPARKKRMGEGDNWRILETSCKGYLFYGLDAPPKPKFNNDESADPEDRSDSEESEAEEEPPTKRQRLEEPSGVPEEQDGGQVVAAEVSPEEEAAKKARKGLHAIRAINWNVDVLSETLLDDLVENPAMVSRFTFKMIPVVATCNPSLDFILPIIKELTSREEIPEGRSAIMGALAILVRNNTTMEQKKKELRKTVEQECFPTNKFFLVYPEKADVLINIAIMHSTCCIGVSRRYQKRCEYNLNRLSERALNLGNMVPETAVAGSPTEKSE